MNAEERCPNCQLDRLRVWEELNEEEQEVVKRLPASADYSLTQRQRTHRWCTRCWYEELEIPSREA